MDQDPAGTRIREVQLTARQGEAIIGRHDGHHRFAQILAPAGGFTRVVQALGALRIGVGREQRFEPAPERVELHEAARRLGLFGGVAHGLMVSETGHERCGAGKAIDHGGLTDEQIGQVGLGEPGLAEAGIADQPLARFAILEPLFEHPVLAAQPDAGDAVAHQPSHRGRVARQLFEGRRVVQDFFQEFRVLYECLQNLPLAQDAPQQRWVIHQLLQAAQIARQGEHERRITDDQVDRLPPAEQLAQQRYLGQQPLLDLILVQQFGGQGRIRGDAFEHAFLRGELFQQRLFTQQALDERAPVQQARDEVLVAGDAGGDSGLVEKGIEKSPVPRQPSPDASVARKVFDHLVARQEPVADDREPMRVGQQPGEGFRLAHQPDDPCAIVRQPLLHAGNSQ
ncbi:MAG: hypothetical protein BWZ08_02391 [candidate division BRC1 bacterium ADurb.BinA292]|nr:MAG: hypothetical protein BWZ08_02391 [candidate division BRC1 bacterium ADurb.BinA292]